MGPEGVNLGLFLNQFAANPTVFWAMFIAALFGLMTFGYFYNQLMDALHKRNEHTSLYVAIGVALTLGVAALFSWKSALLLLVFFAADGGFMIWGEFRRTNKAVDEQHKNPRRKRLPYAANGRIDDARMAVIEASRLLGMALKEKDGTVRALQMANASNELNSANIKLLELKVIQQIEE